MNIEWQWRHLIPLQWTLLIPVTVLDRIGKTEQHTSVNIYTDLRYISDVRSEGAYYEMRLGIRPDDDPPIGKATLFFPVQKLSLIHI